MTDRAETIVCEPTNTSEMSPIVVPVLAHRFALGHIDLLDESWAEEFDRRLAAWESESPIAVPIADEQTA